MGLTLVLGAALGSESALAQDGPGVVEVRVSPDEPVVRRGEVLNVRVTVTNNTDQDFLRDGASGGVGLMLAVPRGFVYRRGSGRVDSVSGANLPLADPDESLSTLELLRDLDGAPQRLNLGAARAITFHYQLIAASPVQPGTVANHRAWVVDGQGDRLSLDGETRIRVAADAEFDEGLVLGRVFCDHDGDGRQGDGEAGLGGVRIISDHGYRADTDRDGMFHFRRLAPGMHLFKVDEASLPPGAEMTTSPRALVQVTQGLVELVAFGVACANLVEVSPETIARDGDDPTPAPAPTAPGPLPIMTLVGSAHAGSLSVDGVALAPLRAELAVDGTKVGVDGRGEATRAINVPWRPGRLDRPLTFRLGLGPGVTPAPGLVWSLRVTRDEGFVQRIVYEVSGQGPPPGTVTWDGTQAGTTVGVLERGGLYRVDLVISDGRSGTATSPPVLLGASWGEDAQEITRQVIREDLFDDRMEPSVRLKSLLRRVVADATGSRRVLVEVHTDMTEVEEMDLTRTRRAAISVARWLEEGLGLRSDRVIAVGLGGTRPLRPNIGERNRAYNRRVEIALLPPEEPGALAVPELPAAQARVRVQEHVVSIDDAGRFVHSVPRPEAGRVLAVVMTAPDGALRSAVIETDPAPRGDARPTPTVAAPPVGMAPPRDPALRVGAPTPAARPEGDDDDDDGPAGLADDPLARFGGRSLRDALGPEAVVAEVREDAEAEGATAGQLRVSLPPRGMSLGTTRVYVPGETHPENALTINGQPVRVDEDGRFAELIDVPSGSSTLVVESRDAGGHVARIEWPITVRDTELFLLALVDGLGGQVGADLQELGPYASADNGTFFLAGRGALYAKARISGTALAQDLFITAHVDSAKRREFTAFFDQVIDPARDYVIFGDASEDIQDTAARGPFYLLVEADKSKLRLGSFRTNFEGVHLLRYHRTFYGAMVDLDHAFAEGWDTRVKAFVSEDNRHLVRRHDELRATGGSLYYLSSREIVEGSEQVWLVVREQDTGMELGRTPLRRDGHYRVDYRTGRLSFASPISSSMDALFAIDGYQPFTGRRMLDGHEVWVVVDYESRAVAAGGNVAFGAHASQTIAGVLEVGGGYVREGRPAGTGRAGDEDDYQLYGGHVRLRLSERSTVFAEVARSEKADGVSLVSTDGGLGYSLLSRSGDRQNGWAFKLGLDARVGEIFDVEGLDLRVQGWWQLLEEGYHVVGLASQQGMEKWGGAVTWRITPQDRLDLRYDGGTVLIEDNAFTTGFRASKRNRWNARYERRLGRVDLLTEGSFGQHRDDLDGQVHDTGALAVGARFRISDRLGLTVSQEALVAGDDEMVGERWTDRMTTNIGLDYRLVDGLAFRLVESVRWNGDNATRIGVHSRLSDGSGFYFEDRIRPGDRNGRLLHSLVFGAEQLLDERGRGRAYGEYRLDGGVDGRTNRAVIGIARRVELAPGVRLTGAYERSQALAGVETGTNRDTASGGLEVMLSDHVRFGGLYEVRWDRPREGNELMQAYLRNALNIQLTPALTVMGIFNYALTQDLATRDVDKEDLEGTFAVAYRAPEASWLTLLARYSRVLHRTRTAAPAGLDDDGIRYVHEARSSDLVSLTAIFELPWRLQLTEKVAWRRTAVELTGASDASYDVLLWINRLAVRLFGDLAIAGEFRLLATLGDGAVTEHGALAELSYTLLDHMRIGVGWNFHGIASTLLPGAEDHDVQQGFYVRMTGMY